MATIQQALWIYAVHLARAARKESAATLVSDPGTLPWVAAGAAFSEAHFAAFARSYGAGSKISDINTSFTLKNPMATGALARNSARFVTEVLDSSRAAINAAVASTYNDGLTTKQLARVIRGYRSKAGVEYPGIVGLHSRDSQAVSRYLNNLLDVKGVPFDKANKAASRYAKQLLIRRGDNIARSELHMGQEDGKVDSWIDALYNGTLGTDTLKRWDTAHSERTCRICLGLHNEVVPVDKPFSNGTMGAYAHPSCRCSSDLFFPGGEEPFPQKLEGDELERALKRNRDYEKSQAGKRRRWLERGATNRKGAI